MSPNLNQRGRRAVAAVTFKPFCFSTVLFESQSVYRKINMCGWELLAIEGRTFCPFTFDVLT